MNYKHYFRWLVGAYIIVVYAMYPHGVLSLNPQTLYQYLTEGFLAGHLGLLLDPPAALINLADPYDPTQNANLGFLWDASFFKGKYYLYFGPLPVIAFYLPFKLVTGFFPPESLAVLFFLSLGFLVGFCLIIKIKDEYFYQLPEWQLIFAGILMGFANGGSYLLARPMVYEVAIASTYCLINCSLFFLYELLRNRSKLRNAALFSFCLSLSVAGRPHFILPCLLLVPILLLLLIKQAPSLRGNSRLAMVCALLLPGICVGVILGLYNYLRFGSVFDFGHVWQLSGNDLRDLHGKLFEIGTICRNIMYGLYFYFLKPYEVIAAFPHVTLPFHLGSTPIDKDYFRESIVGVLTTTPLILMVLGLPKLVMIYWEKKSPELGLCRFLSTVFLIPLSIVLFLISLPIATQRYELDFLPYLVLLSIITFWLLERDFRNSNFFKYVKIFFFTSGIYSIFIGLMLSFAYVFEILYQNRRC